MARMRQVKPQLRTSHVVAAWRIEVRYFWVLLWGYLDDEGRGLDSPKGIAGDCFPHDEDITPAKVDRWIKTIVAAGPLCRYEVAGRRYLHSVNWSEHQRPNRPTPSRIPPCPIHEPLTEDTSPTSDDDSVSQSVSPHGIPTLRGFEGLKGREVEGVEGLKPRGEPLTEPAGTASPSDSEPPRQCPDHQDDPDPPPCGPCADARRRHDRWEADRARADQQQRSATAQQRAALRRAEIERCRLCDDRGYLPGGTACTHDPDRVASNGAARARAALAAARASTEAPEQEDHHHDQEEHAHA